MCEGGAGVHEVCRVTVDKRVGTARMVHVPTTVCHGPHADRINVQRPDRPRAAGTRDGDARGEPSGEPVARFVKPLSALGLNQ